MAPQLQPAALALVDLVRQRLIETVGERSRFAVCFEQERIDRIEVRPQAEATGILAGEDDLAFEGLSVCVRPSDESAGALVGIPATLPSR